MIRTFVTPTESNYNLVLPKELVGQEIEIIVFKKEEGLMKEKTKPTKALSKEKALLIDGIKEAVEELKLIRQGKLKGISAKQLLDEL